MVKPNPTRMALQSLFFLMTFHASLGVAQTLQPCPNGMPAGSGCVPPTPATGAVSRSHPVPVWEDRYGAIAVGKVTITNGTVENELSMGSARRVALERCGARDCHIVSARKNSCHAAAYGGGVIAYDWGLSADEAASKAVGKCNQSGGGCKVEYVGCSLPIRVK